MEQQELLSRLKAVERSNRIMKLFVVATVACCSLLVLLGFSSGVPEELVAKRFVLKDKNGNVRAVLGTKPLRTGEDFAYIAGYGPKKGEDPGNLAWILR